MPKAKKPTKTTKPANSVKDYYKKPLLLVAALIIVLVVYAGYQSILAKKDVVTRRATVVYSQQIDDYITKNKKVPASLSQLPTKKVPSSISYSKIDDKSFVICAYFYRNNDPSLSKWGLFGHLLWNHQTKAMTDSEPSSSTTYGVMSFDDMHVKGIQCQTIVSYKLTPKRSLTTYAAYAAMPYTLCGTKYQFMRTDYTYGNNYVIGLDVPFLSFAPKKSNGEYDYDKRVLGDPQLKVYNKTCQEQPLATLKEGNVVDVYYINDFNYGAEIIIALQTHQ
jgi:hypothetical protein